MASSSSAMAVHIVKAIIGTSEFDRLSGISTVTERDLAYAADLLMERAPWIRDKPLFLFGQTLEDMLIAVFPRISRVFAESVYRTPRPPFNYSTNACIYCDECHEAIEDIGYHWMGMGYDRCQDCFLNRKTKTEPELAAKRMAHPFQQNRCDFSPEFFEDTNRVGSDKLYRAQMRLAYEIKKREALTRYRLALKRVVNNDLLNRVVDDDLVATLQAAVDTTTKRALENPEPDPELTKESKTQDIDDDDKDDDQSDVRVDDISDEDKDKSSVNDNEPTPLTTTSENVEKEKEDE